MYIVVINEILVKLTQPHCKYFEACGLAKDNFVSAHLFLDRRTDGWKAQRGATDRDEKGEETIHI